VSKGKSPAGFPTVDFARIRSIDVREGSDVTKAVRREQTAAGFAGTLAFQAETLYLARRF
jgi:hypothetical protein